MKTAYKLGFLGGQKDPEPGRVVHIIPPMSWKALCGTYPGALSIGWSEREAGPATCSRCIELVTKKTEYGQNERAKLLCALCREGHPLNGMGDHAVDETGEQRRWVVRPCAARRIFEVSACY